MLEEYMLDIGFTEHDIKQIRNIRSANLYNFKSIYQYFHKSGLNNTEFISLVKTIPNIISTSTENIKTRIVLLQELGFNKLNTFNIIKNYPSVEKEMQKLKGNQ